MAYLTAPRGLRGLGSLGVFVQPIAEPFRSQGGGIEQGYTIDYTEGADLVRFRRPDGSLAATVNAAGILRPGGTVKDSKTKAHIYMAGGTKTINPKAWSGSSDSGSPSAASGPGFFDSIAEAIGAAAPLAQRVMEDRARRKEETRARREARRAAATESAPSSGGGGMGTGLLLIGGLGLALFLASKAGLFKK